jgi:CRP-like cAMP-binding protein
MPWENHFLDSLDPADIRELRPHLAPVNLVRNDVLDEVDRPISHIYFPIDSILSVVTVMRTGAQVESRTIGRESGHGLLNALGSPLAFERMTVQVAGRAWRSPLAAMRQAALASPGLVQAVVKHAQASIVQAAQNIACNSLHPAEQRLCRWLLLTEDRLDSNVVPLTQEHLSIMLGVQRTTVTAIASHLQERGAISYVRGKITILDRQALLSCACECYESIETRSAALIAPGR